MTPIDPWFQTHTGIEFSLPEFRVETIDIHDIAHSLSQQCRFNGHTRTFYSVAQHCVLASENVPPADAMWALLHDAPEAYLGDVVGPLKRLLPEYQKLERNLMAVIAERFGLDGAMPRSVRDIDMRLLATEKRDLLPAEEPRVWESIEGVEPLPDRIVPWAPPEAKMKFLAAFGKLGAGQ